MDWKNFLDGLGNELYRSSTAYQSLLPELADLQQVGREYRSSYKLNGEKRPRRDKTIISASMPMVIIEHGEPAKNLVSYIMERDHSDFITVVEQMADLVGAELPQGAGWKDWENKQKQKELLATVQEYYHWCLLNTKSKTTAAVLEYLHSRFTDEQIDKMGLGYIPSRAKLGEYLTGKGYTQEQVREFVDSLPYAADSTNQITIPIYRAGSVYSFIYRHHEQQGAGSKYQYHTKVELKDELQYIPSSIRKGLELVIVEGQLDALHLQAEGIKNVVSTGTNHINTEQVTNALHRGCRKFTLLYDADPTDKDPDKNNKHRCNAIHTITETANKMGLGEEVKVYVAELPQPDPSKKVDPSDYIRENGAAAVQQLIDKAVRGWHYELIQECQKFAGKEITTKQQDATHEAILNIFDYVPTALERSEYKGLVSQYYSLWADREAVEQALEEHAQKKKKEKAQQEAAKLMDDASKLMEAGKVEQALERKDQAASLLAVLDAEQEYEKLTHRTTRAEIVAGLQKMPAAISTGLYLGGEREENEILLPAGALSVIAAPTSHGKTTMLVALAVQAAKANPDKEYYLLSYEEAAEPITLKALSCYAGLELSASNRRTLQHYMTTGSWQYAYTDSTDKQEEYKRKEKEFFDMLEQGRLHLHYTSMVCETLCTNLRRLAKAGKLGGVFIDYVQYLELMNSQRQRHEEISKICRLLKDVAVDTGTPIILAAQFNRDVKDPTKLALQNIGEGGDIERKAAYCIGFFNNDMPILDADKVNAEELHKLTRGAVYDPEHPNKNKSITAIVLKNRNGVGAKAGTTGLLAFDGNIGTVGNYTKPKMEGVVDFGVDNTYI